MKAEIIAVGTEMLMGQIVNTNARDISLKLAELGIDVYYQTVVGDNAARIRAAIELGCSRADLLIFTGGLGPTQDDITKDVLADFVGRTLEIHGPSMDKIERLFSSRGVVEMVKSNVRQAHSIVGAEPLRNDAGLAVGNALVHNSNMFILLPGPPREMKAMLNGPVVEWLRTVMTEETPLYSRLLKFAGIGESSLEAALMPLIEKQTDPTLAPYAKEGEVAIRISTKAANSDEANKKIDEMVMQIKEYVGEHLYADQDIPIENAVVSMLLAKKMTVASAESLTGGLFAQLMSGVPGSSACFDGGVVTYTNDMKHKLLGISMKHLEGKDSPGAVSASTAKQMAENVRELLDSDFGISTTGVAGPNTCEGKPIGMVFIAIAQKDAETEVFELSLSGDRESIQLRTVKGLQYRLWKAIKRLT